ncbi:histidine kinase [Saccharopolyspora erythraea]|uniref:sensor histidine kinase n=1 Tax=Saccharopolyspora erythraea TaxID=1836 RepID=UPI001BAA3CF7|nr:histidine kinase [Saccharopolyspora erythraea]QUH00101.1 histidine kinase [Saccharopolyspora erythraea]
MPDPTDVRRTRPTGSDPTGDHPTPPSGERHASAQEGESTAPREPEFNTRRILRLRRLTWWAIVPTVPLFACMAGVFAVAVPAETGISTVQIAALVAILVVVAVEGTRFSLGMMGGLGKPRQHPLEQAGAFVLAVAGMCYAIWLSPPNVLTWTLLPSALAGALAAAAPRRFRLRLATGLIVLVVAVGPVSMVLAGKSELSGSVLFYSAFVSGATVFAMIFQAWVWDIVLELDRARWVSAELAVARERLRFAADLHDVQGHHLQAIALKGELAERLVGVDDDAARAQAAEVAELARTALRDTREVVHGYRRTSLATEIDNAVRILHSAGIDTAVDGDPALVPPPLEPLFGALVREGATNVLRHSRARHCELEIRADDGRVRVVLRNDGIIGGGDSAGSGIDGLRERFATLGGQVRAACRDGWFELTGLADEPGRPRS